MWHRKSFLVFLLLSVLAAGCGGNPASTRQPAPGLWQVHITPSLEWMRPYLNTCAGQIEGVGIIVSVRPASTLDPVNSDFTLRMGQQAGFRGFAAEIGTDELVVIVHPQNPIMSLSSADLQTIYGDEEQAWNQIDPALPLALMAAAWRYASGEDIQSVWDSVVGLPMVPGSFTLLAPSPFDLRAGVASDPAGVGFLPARWLDDSVRRVELRDVDAGLLRVPILALSPLEPNGEKLEWLLCVQQSLVK